ncbi:MAG: hypothetical protein K2Y42_19850 [Hyphomicrobium sp.]|jgi:hypothetical protein|uniref:hypothetical protein n=1 Tax=Hyphomicrobium sp. TaxID=82 RepID=UPI0025C18931|nr:hypothetical protein [Hyphomicrobium sp.]MBX9865002.1 hypothetical protein [Hyphomicrobium sp.]
MGQDTLAARAAYDKGAERVWFAAVELYGCKTCAAAAVQSLFRTTGEEMGSDDPNCGLSYGDEIEVNVKAHSGSPVRKVMGDRGRGLEEQLAMEVKATWLSLRQVMSCTHCLNATFLFDIWMMHDGMYWVIAEKTEPRAVVCQDCSVAGNGQV